MHSKTTSTAYARMREMMETIPAEPFPTQPEPDESNEAFAERKRRWARDNSERILQDPYFQGCECACHNGWPTYHVSPCHPDGYEAPIESF